MQVGAERDHLGVNVVVLPDGAVNLAPFEAFDGDLTMTPVEHGVAAVDLLILEDDERMNEPNFLDREEQLVNLLFVSERPRWQQVERRHG